MKISQILDYLKSENIPYSFSGDADKEINGFSSLSRYKDGSITWIKRQENIPENFDISRLHLVFTTEEVSGNFSNVIRTAQSKRAFFSTIEHFYEKPEEHPPIGYGTYISPKVRLGKSVRIGHNCTLDGEIII